jgi:hypothetical protein
MATQLFGIGRYSAEDGHYQRLVSAGASHGAAKQTMEVYSGTALLLFGAALNAIGSMPNDNLSAALYCTRHTFISLALTAGENIKAIAEQCGTSAQMIEQHYGRYMSSDFGARMIAELEQETGKTERKPENDERIWRPRRDLNPFNHLPKTYINF